MKRFSLITLWVFVLNFRVLAGEDDSLKNKVERPFILKLDMISPLLVNSNILYEGSNPFSFAVVGEYLFGRKSSVQLTILSYNVHWNSFYTPMDNYSIGKVNGVILCPEYKFYVSRKKRHSGYFIGASAFYLFEREAVEYHNAGVWSATYNAPYQFQYYPPYVSHYRGYENVIGAGFCNGLQFYIEKRISLEVVAGLMYIEEFDNEGGHYYDILPRLSGNLGYRFGIKRKPAAPEIPWD